MELPALTESPEIVQGLVLLSQVVMGLALASATGLRAFLPLLIVGAGGRLDWLPLSGSFEWLESTPALTVFGVAVIAELLADKIPVVDSFLDALLVVVKPVTGTVVVASVLTELTPLQTAVVALVTGGGAATAVHVLKAKVRLSALVASAGLANPVISVVEDAGSLAGTAVAAVAPVIPVLGLLLL